MVHFANEIFAMTDDPIGTNVALIKYLPNKQKEILLDEYIRRLVEKISDGGIKKIHSVLCFFSFFLFLFPESIPYKIGHSHFIY